MDHALSCSYPFASIVGNGLLTPKHQDNSDSVCCKAQCWSLLRVSRSFDGLWRFFVLHKQKDSGGQQTSTDLCIVVRWRVTTRSVTIALRSTGIDEESVKRIPRRIIDHTGWNRWSRTCLCSMHRARHRDGSISKISKARTSLFIKPITRFCTKDTRIKETKCHWLMQAPCHWFSIVYDRSTDSRTRECQTHCNTAIPLLIVSSSVNPASPLSLISWTKYRPTVNQ